MLLAAGQNSHHMMLTLALAISAGTMLIAIARKTGLPSIVLLLAGGILLGPAVMGDHAFIKPDSLGDSLSVVVSMAIGIILFEGGLTLDVSGYKTAPAMIKRLLSIGVLTTWIVSTAAVALIGGVEIKYAALAGSMVVVTGPTVIGPLLKRIRANEKVSSIMHWEGVLIDPIGVFLALLCFDVVVSGASGQEAATSLGLRFVSGLLFGGAVGATLAWITRRQLVSDELLNVVAFGFAMIAFAAAEAIRSEAGLLSVTVAGFVFAFFGPPIVKQVKTFKAAITDILIGTLFILLSARLEIGQFREFGVTGLLAVVAVVFVARPIAIAICSIRTDLTLPERGFLAWVAPRGIVAASIASLFAIKMVDSSTGDAAAATAAESGMMSIEQKALFVETFVYAVIIGTIVLHGLTAGPLARLLGVRAAEPKGWLIVGAHPFATRVAEFLVRRGLPVILVDNNPRRVRDAESRGLKALRADAREKNLLTHPSMVGVGHMLALTDNEDLNVRLCRIWSELLSPDRVFRCNPNQRDPDLDEDEQAPGRTVWSHLPRPSVLASELQRGQASVVASRGSASVLTRLAKPLIAFDADGNFDFDPPMDDAADDENPPEILYLKRTSDHLLWSMRPNLVVDIEADGLASMFEKLIDIVIEEFPTIPRNETINDLLDRESSVPTVLGHGVAAPHIHAAGLDSRVTVVARSREGIQFSPDGDPVHLIFLLLSPKGDPEGHLATLSEVARLMLDPDVRRRLEEAPSVLDVTSIISEARKDV